jgi:hypothetical protein
LSDDLRPPSRRAALLEGLTALEPARFAVNGLRVARQPRGNGRPVFVLPGFGAGDGSTSPLRAYLRGLGHDARGWGLGRNGGDVQGLTRAMLDKVERLADRSGAKVALVGWSLGGVVSREVARERPDLVEQVITFGSPVVGGPKYTRVGEVYRRRGHDLDQIEAIVDERNRRPITVPITAIYTRSDGVVAWQACIDRTNPDVEHVEVRTTHLGLGVHHEVFIEVATRLARPRRSAGRP